MRALLIMLALVVGDVAHAGAAPQIVVSSASELQAAPATTR